MEIYFYWFLGEFTLVMANADLSINAEPVSDENDDVVSVRSELSNSTSSKSRNGFASQSSRF